MSASVGLGVPIPKMLPITGTWTLPFAAYLMVLSNRVIMNRINSKTNIGDISTKSVMTDPNANGPDELRVNSRAHANFLENVPFAFVLAAVAELNGANKKALNYSLAALLIARICHVELGIRSKDTVGWGRPFGYATTSGILTGLAAYSLYLTKGYWGF